MRQFTINGKTYNAVRFEIGTVCDLEDYGISLDNMFERSTSLIRAYIGICSGRGKAYANQEMQAHIINGGNFDEINEVIVKEITESDFFQKILERAQETTAEETTEEEKPKKKSTKA